MHALFATDAAEADRVESQLASVDWLEVNRLNAPTKAANRESANANFKTF